MMKNVLLLVGMLMLGTVAPSETDRQFIAGDLDYLAGFYKSLHQNPELSRQEQNTAKKVADELREIGFEATENVGGYSVVGIMKNGEGPRALYRTDMDALPMWGKPRPGFQHRRDVGDSPPPRSVAHRPWKSSVIPALVECNGAKCRNLTPSRLRADSGISPMRSENRNDGGDGKTSMTGRE